MRPTTRATILEEASAIQVPDTALLREAALAEDWSDRKGMRHVRLGSPGRGKM